MEALEILERRTKFVTCDKAWHELSQMSYLESLANEIPWIMASGDNTLWLTIQY